MIRYQSAISRLSSLKESLTFICRFVQIIRSSGALYVPYFVIGIFFCSFYLMNLVLAVVYLSYEQELCSEEKEVINNDPASILLLLE